jgi:hypothetical protein
MKTVFGERRMTKQKEKAEYFCALKRCGMKSEPDRENEGNSQ